MLELLRGWRGEDGWKRVCINGASAKKLRRQASGGYMVREWGDVFEKSTASLANFQMPGFLVEDTSTILLAVVIQ